MKYLLFIFLCCNYLLSQGQINFVANPSFELKTQCPNNCCQLNYSTGWINPSSVATPDFYSTCQSNNMAGAPANYWGWQNAKLGQNYGGFFSYYSVFGYQSLREYVETSLSDTLSRKVKYHIEFYVSLSDSSSLAVSKMGVYFSDTLYTTNSFRTLPFMPQIVNPSSNLLSDKTNWMKVEGNYIANGGEKFIIIGTFADSSQIDTTYIGNGFNAFWRVAYYYIDDVSVTLYDSTISVNELKANNQIEIFPNPVASTLHFNNLDLIQSTILKVENMFGQTIMEAELKENEINVTDLLPGLYFLKIKNEQGYKVAKFLKE